MQASNRAETAQSIAEKVDATVTTINAATEVIDTVSDELGKVNKFAVRCTFYVWS